MDINSILAEVLYAVVPLVYEKTIGLSNDISSGVNVEIYNVFVKDIYATISLWKRFFSIYAYIPTVESSRELCS